MWHITGGYGDGRHRAAGPPMLCGQVALSYDGAMTDLDQQIIDQPFHYVAYGITAGVTVGSAATTFLLSPTGAPSTIAAAWTLVSVIALTVSAAITHRAFARIMPPQ